MDSDDGSIYEENDHSDSSDQGQQSPSERLTQHEANPSISKTDLKIAKKKHQDQRQLKSGTSAFRNSKSLKPIFNEGYRDLYNDTVEEIINPFLATHDIVPASCIGLTPWETTEKEVLLQQIPVLGRDNVKGIAKAIQTKSETEVQQYLMLLDQGVVEGNVTLELPQISAVDIPAAFEVSKESEDALEAFAAGLSNYQEKGDQYREKKRYGDHWLLTEDVAWELENEINARSDSSIENKIEDTTDDLTPEEFENESNGSDGERGSNLDEGSLPVPADELLHLPTWLRLSQLFMCQSPNYGESWTDLVASPKETPSMYHTTFQDFHNLTVSLTRRVVQASIFQAMTRLRARDKDQPSTAVNGADVRTAVDMMGPRWDKQRFWAELPRRHGLKVFTRSTKHEKGSTRTGTRVSLEEAEKRLRSAIESKDEKDTDIDDAIDTVEKEIVETEHEDAEETEDEDIWDLDQYYEDSELWTEASESGNDEQAMDLDKSAEDRYPDMSDDEDDPIYYPSENGEVEGEDSDDENVAKKRRKKGEHSTRHSKAQDAYLEAFDVEAGQLEEMHIWDTLKVPPPNDIKNEQIEMPSQPKNLKRVFDGSDWREDVDYQAEWERMPAAIKTEEFDKMQRRGERGRKRRRMAYEQLQRQGLVTLENRQSETTVNRKKIQSQDVVMTDASNGAQASTGAEFFSRASSMTPSSTSKPRKSDREKSHAALEKSLAKRLARQEAEKQGKEREGSTEVIQEGLTKAIGLKTAEEALAEVAMREKRKAENKQHMEEEKAARLRKKEERKQREEEEKAAREKEKEGRHARKKAKEEEAARKREEKEARQRVRESEVENAAVPRTRTKRKSGF